MIESWRWYGEFDAITLPEVAQTGARGIVTALHAIPYGEIWSPEAIAERKAQIVAAGFDWVVTESLPVHEHIKRGQGDLSQLFANYRQSMANLAAQGINTIDVAAQASQINIVFFKEHIDPGKQQVGVGAGFDK